MITKVKSVMNLLSILIYDHLGTAGTGSRIQPQKKKKNFFI